MWHLLILYNVETPPPSPFDFDLLNGRKWFIYIYFFLISVFFFRKKNVLFAQFVRKYILTHGLLFNDETSGLETVFIL